VTDKGIVKTNASLFLRPLFGLFRSQQAARTVLVLLTTALAAPPNYPHVEAVGEIAVSLSDMLVSLGRDTILCPRTVRPGHRIAQPAFETMSRRVFCEYQRQVRKAA
jgi:hypothetical protein